jgi:hypothetical protein
MSGASWRAMEATGRRRETVIQALRAGRLCWLTSALILRLPLSHGNVYASGRCKAVFLLLACCTQEENDVNPLLEDLAEAVAEGRRKQFMESVATVPLLIIDDFGMRKLPLTAAEDLLEIIMRRYERTSTLLTSNRPVEDWGKLLGDVAAVTAMLDRILHHGHVLKCGPRSWRTKDAAAAAAGATQ